MKGQPSNFTGDYMTLGGLVVMKKTGTGGIQYMFREEVGATFSPTLAPILVRL